MATKQTVTISIAGPPGVGKSAILNRIANVLEGYGFEIEIVGQVTMREPEKLTNTLKSLARGTSVRMTEIKPRRTTDAPASPVKITDGDSNV